jgi:hypothetical protein
MTACCPFCHQTLGTQRLGVRLPRLKAEIVDAIKAAGDLGISRDELMHTVYRDRSCPSPATIKAHVAQLNDLLAETSFVIRADGRRFRDGSRYYLTRRRRP